MNTGAPEGSIHPPLIVMHQVVNTHGFIISLLNIKPWKGKTVKFNVTS
jgi:hypothetical protein